jgi:hypothetical protein
MNDDLEFKRRWKEHGPALPPPPAGLSAKVWARLRPQPRWGLPHWAGAAALAGFLLGAGFWLGRAQSAGATEVRFRLTAPRASQVALSGSFDDWKPLPMQREGDDWVLELKLKPGTHRYVFVLNGKRSLPDPEGGEAELGPDGQAQTVLYLPKTQAL